MPCLGTQTDEVWDTQKELESKVIGLQREVSKIAEQRKILENLKAREDYIKAEQIKDRVNQLCRAALRILINAMTGIGNVTKTEVERTVFSLSEEAASFNFIGLAELLSFMMRLSLGTGVEVIAIERSSL